MLASEISNTMDSAFCVRTLQAALRTTGRKPKIFNTDQGSQFTGTDWMKFYNHRRKHQTHGYSRPWSVYQPPVCQAA